MSGKQTEKRTVTQGRSSKRSFSNDFKVKTIRPIVEGKSKLSDAARKLDIKDAQLYRWKRNYLQGKLLPKTHQQGSRKHTPNTAQLKKESRKVLSEHGRSKRALTVRICDTLKRALTALIGDEGSR